MVLYIPGGAGFLPSTVSLLNVCFRCQVESCSWDESSNFSAKWDTKISATNLFERLTTPRFQAIISPQGLTETFLSTKSTSCPSSTFTGWLSERDQRLILQTSDGTGDASEIRRSPVDMANILLFTTGFIHPNGGWPWDFSSQIHVGVERPMEFSASEW